MNLNASIALALTVLGLASCTTTGSTHSDTSSETTPPPRGYTAPVSPFATASGS